jgi:hypothetical protein
MSLSLLKPQGMFFIWIFWLWIYRKRWMEMLVPFGLVLLVTVPISLVGSPPLFLQWINNLQNPSVQNEYYWTMNNLSLTSSLGLLPGLAVLLLAILIVATGVRLNWIQWSRNHLYTSLLLLSFFVLPYTSQQSLSSAFAFIPSWPAFAIQFGRRFLGIRYLDYYINIPLYVLFCALIALFCFKPQKK